MTTIITIVVVALVFFVTVCIVTFMIWKREAEMRTDSIKAIEHNVEEMLHELTGGSSRDIKRRTRREETCSRHDEPQHETNDREQKEIHREEIHKEDIHSDLIQKKPYDPFEWVRTENEPEKDDESVTVFDPAAIQYTSFDRGGGLPERDGKRGLKWKEIQQPQEEDAPEVSEPPKVKETPETAEVPETRETPEVVEEPEPEHPEPEPVYEEPEPEPVSVDQEVAGEPEIRNGGPFSKFLKRHNKKNRIQQEPDIIQEDEAPGQQIYETVDDLLRDYISEPHETPEEPEVHYSEHVRPGYDVGKSGRKYTAAELETLIKE